MFFCLNRRTCFRNSFRPITVFLHCKKTVIKLKDSLANYCKTIIDGRIFIFYAYFYIYFYTLFYICCLYWISVYFKYFVCDLELMVYWNVFLLCLFVPWKHVFKVSLRFWCRRFRVKYMFSWLFDALSYILFVFKLAVLVVLLRHTQSLKANFGQLRHAIFRTVENNLNKIELKVCDVTALLTYSIWKRSKIIIWPKWFVRVLTPLRRVTHYCMVEYFNILNISSCMYTEETFLQNCRGLTKTCFLYTDSSVWINNKWL